MLLVRRSPVQPSACRIPTLNASGGPGDLLSADPCQEHLCVVRPGEIPEALGRDALPGHCIAKREAQWPRAEAAVPTMRRGTGRKDLAEAMARIVLEGLRGDERSGARGWSNCRPTTTPATRRLELSSPPCVRSSTGSRPPSTSRVPPALRAGRACHPRPLDSLPASGQSRNPGRRPGVHLAGILQRKELLPALLSTVAGCLIPGFQRGLSRPVGRHDA